MADNLDLPALTPHDGAISPTDKMKWAGWIGGVVFIVVILILALWVPNPTGFQEFAFRVPMAMGAAAFAAFVPGFVLVQAFTKKEDTQAAFCAGGAIVIFFVLMYANPTRLGAPAARLFGRDTANLRITNLKRADESNVMPAPDGKGLVFTSLKPRITTHYQVSEPGQFCVGFVFACRGYKVDADGNIDVRATATIRNADGRVLARTNLDNASRPGEFVRRSGDARVTKRDALAFLSLGTDDDLLVYLVVLDDFKRSEIPEKQGRVDIELTDQKTGQRATDQLPIDVSWR